MLRLEYEAFRASVLHHMAPRLVGTIIGTADGTPHMSRLTSTHASDAPWRRRPLIHQTALRLLAPDFRAGRLPMTRTFVRQRYALASLARHVFQMAGARIGDAICAAYLMPRGGRWTFSCAFYTVRAQVLIEQADATGRARYFITGICNTQKKRG